MDARAQMAVCCIILAGCAGQSVPITDQTRPASEATEEQVAECEFLQTVFGQSPWAGAAARKGHRAARGRMLKAATDIGATHVVIERVGPAPNIGTHAEGRAYSCLEAD